jgi:hypothetical protein
LQNFGSYHLAFKKNAIFRRKLAQIADNYNHNIDPGLRT